MEYHIDEFKIYFNELIDTLKPSVLYAFQKIYETYEEINTYLFTPKAKGMIILMNYNVIEKILIDGKSVEWSLTNNNHFQNTVAQKENSIEIQYSNFENRYRYILEEGERILDVCNELIWQVSDDRTQDLVKMARYKTADGTFTDITADLNEYTHPKDTSITIDYFEWDKMYHSGICLDHCDIHIIDNNGDEFFRASSH